MSDIELTDIELVHDTFHGWCYLAPTSDGLNIWHTGFLTRRGAKRSAKRHLRTLNKINRKQTEQ